MRNKLLYIFLLILSFQVFSQPGRQTITGKVVSGSYRIPGILIVNIQAQKEVKTDTLGIFRILARKGDTLIITDPGIQTVKIIVEEAFIKDLQIVEVTMNQTHELDAVIVEKNNRLTAEALRIVPKGKAKYTPAERKAEAGARLGPRSDKNIGGGIVFNTDAIINLFSGKRKALKKAVQVERTEKNIELLSAIYDEENLLSNYSIPKDYYRGFLYYAAADEDLASAIQIQNTSMVEMLISQLAIKYLELIKEGK